MGDSTFYRKSVNDYYHYINVDTFASFYYDVPQRTEIIFLKENATVGTTWTSVDFTGASGGISTVLRYSFTIAATGSTLIVNGVTYNNVIRVDWKAMENVNGAGFTDAHFAGDTFFDQTVTFRGAIAPAGLLASWWKGWTKF